MVFKKKNTDAQKCKRILNISRKTPNKFYQGIFGKELAATTDLSFGRFRVTVQASLRC